MGFFQPTEPPFEIEEWQRLLAPGADQAARPGLGDERVRHAGRRLPPLHRQADPLRRRRPAADLGDDAGLGGLGDLADWWTEPIVFEKAVVWTMLWEVLGLGAGSLPLTLRFSPMIGGVLYWLRPGTVRLPPWPERVPLTRGDDPHARSTSRLYAGLLACRALPAARRTAIDRRRRRHARPPRPGRGRRRCSPSWRRSACATRSRSWRPGPRSTAT